MIEQGVIGRSLRSLRLPSRSRRGPAGRADRPTSSGGSSRVSSRGSSRGSSRTRAGGRVRAGRRLRLLLALLAGLALVAGGWLWLRDSPLVSVDRVTISGVGGAEAPQIRAALTNAARGMTTLDVRTATLRAAVSSYPVVNGLSVSSSFPHGLHISVHEQLPVAAIVIGTRQVPVAADGTVLHEGEASGTLPTLSLKAVPGGSTVQDPSGRLELSVLAAAPARMLARISGVSVNYWHGVVVAVRQGPAIYFGRGDRLEAKWQAVMAVLATPSTAGASYLDVADPQRPAAGPANPASASATTSPAGSASTAASTSTPSPQAQSTASAPATGTISPTTAVTSTTPGGG